MTTQAPPRAASGSVAPRSHPSRSTAPRHAAHPARRPGDAEPRVVRLPVGLATAAVLLAAVVLRFVTVSDLWLDEAQAVAIARLPLPELFDALREDGSPALYYLLLHAWTAVVGEGDVAVRSLSGVASVAALPVAWDVGRRLAGRPTAWAAAVVVACSPFAVRFATEARMYALLTLLGLLGAHALLLAGRPGRHAGPTLYVAAVTAALVHTHYWTWPLLAVTGLGVLVRLVRGPRVPAARVAVGGFLGALTILPWVPSLLFQLEHTGAPWAAPPPVGPAVLRALTAWSGGETLPAVGLVLLTAALAVLGLVALAPADDRSLVLVDVRGSRAGRLLLGASLGALALGVAAAGRVDVAYTFRYSSPVLGPFLLLVALGVGAMPRRRARVATLALVAVLGLAAALPAATEQRTSAGLVAAVLRAEADPDDRVVYCPDQYGPSVSRLTPDGLDERTYPTGADPERVDWVDYAERNRAADPPADARRLLAAAGDDDVWLVLGTGYLTYGGSCQALDAALSAARPAVERVGLQPRPRGLPGIGFESPRLVQYPPAEAAGEVAAGAGTAGGRDPAGPGS